ncbi:PREDICTED: peptidyl-prolyl cis-trans isomerase FKBP12-like [Brassica oleracea var. oleracea]|uniref:peptidyl-prolyl cis-trans isomerase FKBP12-like n=1 Tax=Brassica oleracea var. oleracea TaxID=109376 RepID=UPI0006A6F8D0|nr:PREDICTED: peptidyl-prolyl cis-trans isomerase FKBP12-like [Brassica oleracea var. oleracea]
MVVVVEVVVLVGHDFALLLPRLRSSSISPNSQRERDGAAGNGAEKQIIRPGTGPKRAPDQTVTVHCTGFGKGGDLSQQFWSTKDAGQKPFSFIVGKGAVIKGVIGMQIGEVARLRVCRLLFSSCKHI